ncbi:MAG: MFS transporter [Gammaproteobacteria bacterium]|nr:MFS transporter [Gammaproteobacteria bacterium]
MTTSRPVAWSFWILCSLFYAYQYILRVMPSLMVGDLMQQFHIDATLFGQYSGVYYIGYALMHIPLGLLLDRYGPRKVMTICILLCVVGNLPIVFADHWMYPILGRVLLGIGSSAAILSTFKIIRMVFQEKLFTRMLSLSVTIGLLGAIYGGGPVSFLCGKWGYQTVVEVFAALGIILALASYLILPDIKFQQKEGIMKGIKAVFTNTRVLAVCFFAGCMVGPLEGFADVWGAVFLKQAYGLNPDVANYLPSLIFLGMCFGAPVLSLIAEKTENYLACIITAGSLMLMFFIALICHWLNVASISVGFVIVGICCAYQILAIYKASTYVSDHVAGLMTAVANMIIMSFGYAFHSIIGYAVNLYGGPAVGQALVNGLSILPAGLAVGVLGFAFLSLTEKSFQGHAKSL